MIIPRLITRTHYQVDEPAYIRELVIHCASAVKSNYPERVAHRLVERLNKHDKVLNLPAAGYAVDLARALGILTENLTWSDQAHLLNVIASPEAECVGSTLSIKEKLFFFRAFLYADGAALLFLARVFRESRVIPPPDQNWNDIANRMVLDVYDEYLNFVLDVQSRTQIRNLIVRRRRNPFSGKSGPHQVFVHVHTLFRLGLLEKRESGNLREYERKTSSPGRKSALDILLALLPNLKALEDVIKNERWLDVAGDVFADQLPSRNNPITPRGRSVISSIRKTYRYIMQTGVTLCPLRALIESLQIDLLCSGVAVPSFSQVIHHLTEYQRINPQSVRFHVDRYGHPAFLKLSD